MNWSCKWAEVFVKVPVKNIKLGNQEMEPVDICQAKYDARFVRSLLQDRDVMTRKKIL